MKIGYLAKHDSGLADDEGAITHALEALGHRVERLREKRAYMAYRLDVDFVLFHHCQDYSALALVQRPKVFWVFDLIDYPDPTLERRNAQRRLWMRQATAVADLGFLTDGDWVDRDRTGKLHWLPQGADERAIGVGAPAHATIPLLFTGSDRGGGEQRTEFVEDMRRRYGGAFRHVQRGVYRRELADLITSAAIVVAPTGPVSDRYWSNRVYNTLGFGGFLLHPYSAGLAEHYQDRREIVFYRDAEDLHQQIAYALERPDERDRVADAGLKRTQAEHLYRHRCAQLVETVKERLRLG